VDDVARGICLAVEAEGIGSEIFNLGESRTYPMAQWAQMILDAAGSSAQLVRVPSSKLPLDLGITGTIHQHLLVDSSKARAALGWRDTEHGEALRTSVAWHLANPPEQSATDFAPDDTALAD
jgi:nucleoside-diphosphate-sugar epimerase